MTARNILEQLFEKYADSTALNVSVISEDSWYDLITDIIKLIEDERERILESTIETMLKVEE